MLENMEFDIFRQHLWIKIEGQDQNAESSVLVKYSARDEGIGMLL